MNMEVRSEPSFDTCFHNLPSSSPFPAVQTMQVDYTSGGGDSLASQGLTANAGERLKRKRGRPRKYASPDGQMPFLMLPSSLGAGPPSSPSAAQQQLQSAGFSSGFTLSPVPAMKKKKAKPLGSGKKHQMDLLGSSGIGFTPHVITVQTGEDVSAKIMSFSNNGPRAVCILSANGAISNVTVRQAGSSGGTATYEGRYEILSLSGSILPSESSGQCSRTGGLSVALAGPDGHVLGGGVAGPLIAATPVQVVVGSFIADSRRKEQQSASPLVFEPATEKPSQGAPPPEPSSPASRGMVSEKASGGGHGNPYNQSSNGSNHYNGINSQGLPVMHWK